MVYNTEYVNAPTIFSLNIFKDVRIDASIQNHKALSVSSYYLIDERYFPNKTSDIASLVEYTKQRYDEREHYTLLMIIFPLGHNFPIVLSILGLVSVSVSSQYPSIGRCLGVKRINVTSLKNCLFICHYFIVNSVVDFAGGMLVTEVSASMVDGLYRYV